MAGLAALLATFAAPVLTADAGAQAVLETWLDPLAVWCWALFGAGLVVASAAASILRPLVLLPLLRRAGDAVVHPPDRPWPRAARAVAAIALGVVAIADPLTVLEVGVVSAGLLLVVAGDERAAAARGRAGRAARSRPPRSGARPGSRRWPPRSSPAWP